MAKIKKRNYSNNKFAGLPTKIETLGEGEYFAEVKELSFDETEKRIVFELEIFKDEETSFSRKKYYDVAEVVIERTPLWYLINAFDAFDEDGDIDWDVIFSYKGKDVLVEMARGSNGIFIKNIYPYYEDEDCEEEDSYDYYEE